MTSKQTKSTCSTGRFASYRQRPKSVTTVQRIQMPPCFSKGNRISARACSSLYMYCWAGLPPLDEICPAASTSFCRTSTSSTEPAVTTLSPVSSAICRLVACLRSFRTRRTRLIFTSLITRALPPMFFICPHLIIILLYKSIIINGFFSRENINKPGR
ncbi:hypothetical protein D3C74_381820 [compost metagenome]